MMARLSNDWSDYVVDGEPAAIGLVPMAAVAYDEALRSQIQPWYRSSVEQYCEARRVAAALPEEPTRSHRPPTNAC